VNAFGGVAKATLAPTRIYECPLVAMVLCPVCRPSTNDERKSALGHERRLCDRWLPLDFCYASFATEVMRRCKMTRWARNRHVSRE
jgi:hypothetical protein